ncbi:hypothetical protein F5B21DRAFT_509908 [Xylaria acuta]|nr:hypothetical protein F5B21DRAFT_509908 [Xylaria acuta]
MARYEWLGLVEAAGPTSPYEVGTALFGLTGFGHWRPVEISVHRDIILAETGVGSVSYRFPEHSLIKGGFAFPGAGIDGVEPGGRATLITPYNLRPPQASAQSTRPRLPRTMRPCLLWTWLGASITTPTVVDEVHAAASGRELAAVFDAVASGIMKSRSCHG